MKLPKYPCRTTGTGIHPTATGSSGLIAQRFSGILGGCGWSRNVAGDVRNQFQVVVRKKSGGINGGKNGSKLRVFELQSLAFWSVSGDEDGMDTLLVSQVSNRYQARPVRWPETGELVGSSRGFRVGYGSNSSQLFSLSLACLLSLPFSLSLNIYRWSTGSKKWVWGITNFPPSKNFVLEIHL